MVIILKPQLEAGFSHRPGLAKFCVYLLRRLCGFIDPGMAGEGPGHPAEEEGQER